MFQTTNQWLIVAIRGHNLIIVFKPQDSHDRGIPVRLWRFLSQGHFGKLHHTVDATNPGPPKGWLKPYINNGINHISTGAGFFPSTVWSLYYHIRKVVQSPAMSLLCVRNPRSRTATVNGWSSITPPDSHMIQESTKTFIYMECPILFTIEIFCPSKSLCPVDYSRLKWFKPACPWNFLQGGAP